MEPNQEIVRHWILNLAIEGRRRLSDFVPYVESVHLNVHPVPGVVPEHFAEAFLALFDAGLIRCAFGRNGDPWGVAADRSAVTAVLDARLRLPQVTSKVHIGLPGPVGPKSPDLRWETTSAGGEEWERLAKPDWGRYVFVLFDMAAEEGSHNSGEAWSVDLDSLMIEVGWSGEFNGEAIDRESIALEVLQDHPITYWKVLPTVYHATFSCRSVSHNEMDLGTTREWFRDWWVSRRKWHKMPWELSGWPDSS